MRLTAEQISIIHEALQGSALPNPQAYLFGSRLRDAAAGGDIDLVVVSDQELGLMRRAGLQATIEGRLGIPVDVVAVKRGAPLTPFQRIALEQAIPL